MQQRRSAVLALAGCVLAAMASVVAAQQPYPNKPIRIIVPLVPGGSTNNIARLVGEKLRESLGQPVIIENRPGANSIVGTEAVARAAPDGYTVLVQSATHTIIPFVEPALPYDPIKDFAAVASLARTRYVMLVHPSVPVKTVKDLIAHAKAYPGVLNFGSSGSSSGSRLAGEVFNMLAGVDMKNIPYKGSGQMQVDLLAGRIQVSFSSTLVAAPLVNSGKLTGLAISGENRLSLMPQVPTFIESGLPAFNEQAWFGMFAPAATPKPVVDRLSNEIARMQSGPEVRDFFEKQGLESLIMTPEQFTAFLKADVTKLAKLVKTANLKFDD